MSEIGLTYAEFLTALALAGGMIGGYVKLKIDMAKVMTEVAELKKKQDKDDLKFNLMFKKIDELKDLIINKL